MMRRTTLADRQEIVALKRAGRSHTEVATASGWSVATVRKVWSQFQHAGASGLQAPPLGRPPTGPLSTFPWVVRYVALRLKVQRPMLAQMSFELIWQSDRPWQG